MSLPYLRDVYRRPIRLGARVSVTHLGEDGTITGCHEENVAVQFPGGDAPILVHPANLTFHTSKETTP